MGGEAEKLAIEPSESSDPSSIIECGVQEQTCQFHQSTRLRIRPHSSTEVTDWQARSSLANDILNQSSATANVPAGARTLFRLSAAFQGSHGSGRV